MPQEIGQVPLADVCELGSRHYVLNFDDFLRPVEQRVFSRPPKVMVSDNDWGPVCDGLVKCGLCTFLEESQVFQTGSGPLLNGMFGVSKEEWSGGVEVFRLIMNLIPLNRICQPLVGDVVTLPSWSGMTPFQLHPSEGLVVSSEDVRCFFYTLSVPESWWKYMAFNKVVPNTVLPPHLQDSTVYLASRVLPMGFLNSVSLAQHVHRNLVLRSTLHNPVVNLAENELQKDRAFPAGDTRWPVYLDNYDLLEIVDHAKVPLIEGKVAPGAQALRQEYEQWGVPRNLKKSVSRSQHCEMQGAQLDGHLGLAYPRESKLLKYTSAGLKLCSQKLVTQKQLQVVCGGWVYFSMFRRPLLGCLNAVWLFIESFNQSKANKRALPAQCKFEILRFLSLIPLARLDFRLPMRGEVTCSDASSSGGGICVSKGLTPLGTLASEGLLRGEQRESQQDHKILSIGLFDGIGALRVALDLCGAPVLGHISIEKSAEASRVVENHFPGSLFVSDVALVDEEMVCDSLRPPLYYSGQGRPARVFQGLMRTERVH